MPEQLPGSVWSNLYNSTCSARRKAQRVAQSGNLDNVDPVLRALDKYLVKAKNDIGAIGDVYYKKSGFKPQRLVNMLTHISHTSEVVTQFADMTATGTFGPEELSEHWGLIVAQLRVTEGYLLILKRAR